jgi:hypothetical protein
MRRMASAEAYRPGNAIAAELLTAPSREVHAA